jgi:SAM-dependent methyltransferase
MVRSTIKKVSNVALGDVREQLQDTSNQLASSSRQLSEALGDIRAQLRDASNQLASVNRQLSEARALAETKLSTVGPIPVPPPELMGCVGTIPSFFLAGEVMYRDLKSIASLSPEDRILDVGCGIGRTARHIGPALSPTGSYCGFDVMERCVQWCQRNLGTRWPNLYFQHANIHNATYNPNGVYEARTFSFPYPDQTFTLVFLDSVFTHMFPDDIEHYLSEIRRVLVPGGRCLASFFLMDAEARERMAQPGSEYNFKHAGDRYFTTTPERPEDAIAFDEALVRQLYANAGLKIVDPIHYGSWSGRKVDNGSMQDKVLSVRSS